MEITILGTESLGVRGICCRVTTNKQVYLIDPGVALGFLRHGQLPHPCQVHVGNSIRNRILSAFSEATDIIISHYHGDHIPLLDANPYQISLTRIIPSHMTTLWCKGTENISSLSLQRRQDLIAFFGRDFPDAEGINSPDLSFSKAVPHGTPETHVGSVMMTCIREDDECFVHASDIQMLNAEAVDIIMEWEPNVVITSGPPLYLHKISEQEQKLAAKLVMTLASVTDTLIVDHHLLRSYAGYCWLKNISKNTKGNVITAADFMGRKPLLLEACRETLYDTIPVPNNWHESYAQGSADWTTMKINRNLLERICSSYRGCCIDQF